ncbi:tRNA (uridine(34)/cytosine(34)/5-carboxymethylaminomethyluridine(34)-2'-O)-methyltransferase TrmL [Oleiagrimonas sp. C23AA]|uniref:tRNA (uridine(34)/cytosine(34)/5- carboxymethylaminomethyluridine(34)-2'-O)- methyltransferase TrmL n=1 Tax=Oleiagrimonas sp. C23AA TaxID=2719047 RepID=UPI0014243756|nr:tRNA (uridine(34)/cytosine(34)/5-carboxymethylaminomethyluridine(34)-2'-O)-methyltransferase TrmL [Oleiagrimonas sp. C23AA]NII10904.1 tRNA (uridine(34)/cytosine(34)/5-carboxymethylaminomethyluridine(34)-2'-O)-methyltransferase TrmL [Oleiagrimonas sp. C23AA]
MLHVILYRPEIPPNTGNVIRLCANTGAALHLIGPLGFELDDTRLRRAGLDYHEYARVQLHDSLDACLEAIGRPRVFAFSTRSRVRHVDAQFTDGDALLFGCETAGLPAEVFDTIAHEHRLRLPMRADSRSLNLSNSVAVAVYEAWRQLDFAGASIPD